MKRRHRQPHESHPRTCSFFLRSNPPRCKTFEAKRLSLFLQKSFEAEATGNRRS